MDKWPAYARLSTVAPAGHLPTASQHPQTPSRGALSSPRGVAIAREMGGAVASDLTEQIARERWTCVSIFKDAGISGATTLRPGYQALLTAARAGESGYHGCRSTRRLSRDQEDVAALFKRFEFAGIAIMTLAEGQITPLHVGLKGAMNSIHPSESR